MKDKWLKEVERHYQEALKIYSPNQIVTICLQGSQNYGLETDTSDVDTKCILTPSFEEIALGKKMVSTTHILDNNEHLDAKDIRLYCDCFKKQNLNFLEILFTPYCIINPLYKEQWMRLVEHREEIARMNPYRAVKSMKGIALEKYHAMEHPYPSKLDLIERYGFDGKQTHHLLRVDDYLERYIAGVSYEECLRPTEEKIEKMMAYKRHLIPLAAARLEAKEVLAHVEQIADAFCAERVDEEDPKMRELLQDVQYQIMKIAVQKELK